MMIGKIYERGSFSITNQTIHLSDTLITLSSVDSLQPFEFPRHSYFNGLKAWLYGMGFFIIISLIFDLYWLPDVYLYTIVLLLIYNIKQHKKVFYGLKIQTTSDIHYIKSDDQLFIKEIYNAITEAIESRLGNYIINLDSHDIINNGVISYGDNNYNEVSYDK